jgi:hypothetical protein
LVSGVEHMAEALCVRTKGLRAAGHPEITVTVGTASLLPDAGTFLDFVVRYLSESGSMLKSGETLTYGYWLTKFIGTAEGNLEVWEYNRSATEFVPGATLTLEYWKEQNELCNRVNAEFSPPRPDMLTVVSPAVLEGAPVQGVRYPSPAQMSGWWITADDYIGDVKMLRNEHLYHVTDLRPDLARYLALPYGFRFDLSNYEDVWFDRKVADQSVV